MRIRIAKVAMIALLAAIGLGPIQGATPAGAESSGVTHPDAVFSKTRQVIPKGNKEKEVHVHLTVGSSKLVISSKKRSQVMIEIPYESIRDVSYEYGERRRIKEGGMLMVASIGAGALVMFTKSKSHWLSIEHDTAEGGEMTVLHLHKKNFGRIIQALEVGMGRQVRLAGEGR